MLDALIGESYRDGDGDGALMEGVVATAPDADGRVMVVIPALHPSYRHGPCPAMPRGTLMPSRGARCLVAFSDEDRPWLVAWEPAA